MAATNINRVVLTGNLTRDPELRSTPSGMSVCSLRIASNTRRKDNSTGEWVDKPNYFSVTVWGAQGENCARFLAKGRPVCIDGRLEWREWQTQEGQKRESIEIVADAVQFLGGRAADRRAGHAAMEWRDGTATRGVAAAGLLVRDSRRGGGDAGHLELRRGLGRDGHRRRAQVRRLGRARAELDDPEAQLAVRDL